MFLEALQDLVKVHEYSWGGMALTNLYHYLSEATKYQIMSMGGYVILLQVINSTLIIYLFFIFVFMILYLQIQYIFIMGLDQVNNIFS